MSQWLDLGKLTEVPYLAAFIIFAMALFKFFQRWSDNKDKEHAAHMRKSETTWREFLQEQRADFLRSISEITCAIADMKKRQEEHTEVIQEVRIRQEEQGEKLDGLIERLDK